MTKRILAAMLWFYVGWYAGAMLAEMIGVSALLGPLIGAAAAGLIAGDPRHIIWKRRAPRWPRTGRRSWPSRPDLRRHRATTTNES